MARGETERNLVAKAMKDSLHARLCIRDQRTLTMQLSVMSEYEERRGWEVVKETSEVGSGARVGFD